MGSVFCQSLSRFVTKTIFTILLITVRCDESQLNWQLNNY